LAIFGSLGTAGNCLIRVICVHPWWDLIFAQSQEGRSSTNWVGDAELLPLRPRRISQNAMIFGKPVQSFALQDGSEQGLLIGRFIYRQEIKGCRARNAARWQDGKLAAEMP